MEFSFCCLCHAPGVGLGGAGDGGAGGGGVKNFSVGKSDWAPSTVHSSKPFPY